MLALRIIQVMKAIIFDLDGTLLDTVEDIAGSMNTVLQKHGLPPHAIAEYKLFVGDGTTNLVKRAAPGAASAGVTLSQLEAEYRAMYAIRKTDKTAPYAGIPELLGALAGWGVKLAVLSNKPHDATVEVIARYFPGIPFAAVIGQRPGFPVKPDPGGALEILGILGLPREEVLYAGDSGTDMRTAGAAGLQAVGVLWGFREKEELMENGAHAFAERPLDILAFF